jgi:hypothetical protein
LFLVCDSKTGSFSLIGDRAHQALAHVLALEALLGEGVERLEDPFAEGAQVRAAVAGVLAVDERVVDLAVEVGVGEGELEGLVAEVQRRRAASSPISSLSRSSRPFGRDQDWPL